MKKIDLLLLEDTAEEAEELAFFFGREQLPCRSGGECQ